VRGRRGEGEKAPDHARAWSHPEEGFIGALESYLVE